MFFVSVIVMKAEHISRLDIPRCWKLTSHRVGFANKYGVEKNRAQVNIVLKWKVYGFGKGIFYHSDQVCWCIMKP